MPNPDPYLRDGLTPSTDVELYESAALGGTNKTGTATAQGVASGVASRTVNRSGVGVAEAAVHGSQDLTYSKTGHAVAQGAASGTKSVTSDTPVTEPADGSPVIRYRPKRRDDEEALLVAALI